MKTSGNVQAKAKHPLKKAQNNNSCNNPGLKKEEMDKQSIHLQYNNCPYQLNRKEPQQKPLVTEH